MGAMKFCKDCTHYQEDKHGPPKCDQGTTIIHNPVSGAEYRLSPLCARAENGFCKPEALFFTQRTRKRRWWRLFGWSN